MAVDLELLKAILARKVQPQMAPIQRELDAPTPQPIQPPSPEAAQMQAPPMDQGQMPEDPRLTSLYAQQQQMDNPAPPSFRQQVAGWAQGLSTQDPAQFQHGQRLQLGQKFQEEQMKKQALAQQISQILQQKEQQTDNSRQDAMLGLQRNADARAEAAAPVALAHTAAQTQALNTPKPVTPRPPANRKVTRGGKEYIEYFDEMDPSKVTSTVEAGTVAQPTGSKPDYEWVTRDGKPLQIQKGTAKPGDVPYDEVAARQKSDTTEDTLYSQERQRRIIQSVDELTADVSPATVGFSAWLNGVPTTPALKFATDLKTLKSNIVTNELQQMRADSKTGGALGNVSDRESDRLEAALGGLEQKQSVEQMKAQLAKVKTAIETWRAEKAKHGAPGSNITVTGGTADPLGIR